MELFMSLKKLASAMAICMLLVFSACMLGGCGKSAESVIKDDITRQLDSVKKIDGDFASSLANALTAGNFDVYGIDSTAFVQSYFQGFDYSIGEIKVDGDKATAQVTLTCKSYTAFKNAVDSAASSLNSSSEFANLNHDEQYERIGSLVVGALDGAPTAETKPISLSYAKSNDSWKPADNTPQVIAKALLAN